MPGTIVVSGMTFKKSTASTVVFEAQGDSPAVPVIYIKKHAVPGGADPEALKGKTLKLTIEME